MEVAPLNSHLFFTNSSLVDASSLHFIAEDLRKAKDLALSAAAAKKESQALKKDLNDNGGNPGLKKKKTIIEI